MCGVRIVDIVRTGVVEISKGIACRQIWAVSCGAIKIEVSSNSVPSIGTSC